MKQRKRNGKVGAGELRVIRPDVAGADLGAREHYVCAPSVGGVGRDVAAFGSTTSELYRLADWLKARGVKSVAMESTGVYWISVYEVLEGLGLEVVLVNARVLMSVPGRKTDVQDCQWIQLLHSCGLLRGSFRPADAVCGVRSLIRERSVLVRESGDWLRRMQKSLDQMNVRVHHAVADISGATGMAIIRKIVGGERDPKVLAELRDPRCQKTKEQIAEHLRGNWRPEHLFTLSQGLKMYDFAQACIQEYDAQIMALLAQQEKPDLNEQVPPDLLRKDKMNSMNRRNQQPLRHALYRMSGVDLTTIDAIGPETAEVVLSELGTDYSVFPTEGHFVSYLKLSPKLAVSGGKPIRSKKPMSTSTRVGSALRTAATTLRNSKTALGAEFRRLARIKGMGVAVFAMARKLAVLIYRLIRFGQAYVDKGMEAYEQRFIQRRIHACHTMANSLGFNLVAKEPLPT